MVIGSEGGAASEPMMAILLRPSEEMGRIPSLDNNTREAAPISRTNLACSSDVATISGAFARSKLLIATSGKP